MNPQNNASSQENSKSQNKQSKLTSQILLPNQQTPNTLQLITKIMQDVIKPETIEGILKSLKIIRDNYNKSNYDSANRHTNHSRKGHLKKQSYNKIKILYADVRGLKSKLRE